MKHRYAISICVTGIWNRFLWKRGVLHLWGFECNNAEREVTKNCQRGKIRKPRKARKEERVRRGEQEREGERERGRRKRLTGWHKMFEAVQAASRKAAAGDMTARRTQQENIDWVRSSPFHPPTRPTMKNRRDDWMESRRTMFSGCPQLFLPRALKLVHRFSSLRWKRYPARDWTEFGRIIQPLHSPRLSVLGCNTPDQVKAYQKML
jgi:hypothetical protein